MHSWSNEQVDWQGISDAAEYIGRILRTWGRVGVSQTKEKFGTARVYCSFGWYTVNCITHPGYWYVRFPLIGHARIPSFLNRIVSPLQQLLYTHAYGLALKKWPHLRQEILSGADHHELLTKYGVHRVRTSEYSYAVSLDWHPDNYTVREAEAIAAREVEYKLAELGMFKDPVKWVKRDYNV